MESKRKLVAMVGAILIVPIAVFLAIGPASVLNLAKSTNVLVLTIVGYVAEFSGTAGVILLLVAWLGMKRPSVPSSPYSP